MLCRPLHYFGDGKFLEELSPPCSEWHSDKSVFFSLSREAATQSHPAPDGSRSWGCFCLSFRAERPALHLHHTPHLQEGADILFQLSWGAKGARFTTVEKQFPNTSFCMYWLHADSGIDCCFLTSDCSFQALHCGCCHLNFCCRQDEMIQGAGDLRRN